jgi:hypothetical protein
MYQRKHLQLMVNLAYSQLNTAGASKETLKLLDAVMNLYGQYQWDYEDPDAEAMVNDLADDIQDVEYEEKKKLPTGYYDLSPPKGWNKGGNKVKIKPKKKKAKAKPKVPISAPITGELPRKIAW